MEVCGAVGAAGAMFFVAKVFGKGGYRLDRIISFTDPFADPTGTGFQVVQGLYAIGSRRAFWCRTWK